VPRGNEERAVGAFVLIAGVAMFSFLLGNFMDILKKYQTLNANFDDGENLVKFFAILKNFNDGKMVNVELKNDIERFFDYYWNHNKNQAFIEESEYALL
jgi:hypothetical protein